MNEKRIWLAVMVAVAVGPGLFVPFALKFLRSVPPDPPWGKVMDVMDGLRCRLLPPADGARSGRQISLRFEIQNVGAAKRVFAAPRFPPWLGKVGSEIRFRRHGMNAVVFFEKGSENPSVGGLNQVWHLLPFFYEPRQQIELSPRGIHGIELLISLAAEQDRENKFQAGKERRVILADEPGRYKAWVIYIPDPPEPGGVLVDEDSGECLTTSPVEFELLGDSK